MQSPIRRWRTGAAIGSDVPAMIGHGIGFRRRATTKQSESPNQPPRFDQFRIDHWIGQQRHSANGAAILAVFPAGPIERRLPLS
jgi:hypothetical protein